MVYKVATFFKKSFLPASDDVIKIYIWRQILFFLHIEAIMFYQKLVSTQKAT